MLSIVAQRITRMRVDETSDLPNYGRRSIDHGPS